MKWFKHLVASGADPDIGELMDELGADGYYLFFRTLEIMSNEFDIDHPGENSFSFEWLLSQFSRKVSKNKLLKFLEITDRKGRISYNINGKTITLNCPKLRHLTDEYTRQKPYRVKEKVTREVTEKVTNKVTPKIKDTRLKIQDTKKEKEHIYREIIKKWNDFASEHDLSPFMILTKKRIPHFNARLKEKMFDIDLILKALAQSPYCLGQIKDKDWKASLDWIIENDTNYIKVLEGKYFTKPAPSVSDNIDRWARERSEEDE